MRWSHWIYPHVCTRSFSHLLQHSSHMHCVILECCCLIFLLENIYNTVS